MVINRYLNLMITLVAGTILASCVELNGSGYSSLSESDKRHVKSCQYSLDSINNDGNLYKVTVSQVKNLVRRHDKVIVYEYLPFCLGENGRSPVEVKQVCDQKNIQFIVISSVYDGIFPIPPTNTFPLFVIDNSIYDTDNYQTYVEQFYSDLTGSDKEDRQVNPYHYFLKGKYICSYSTVSEFK